MDDGLDAYLEYPEGKKRVGGSEEIASGYPVVPGELYQCR
jgi:hypothetical protein